MTTDILPCLCMTCGVKNYEGENQDDSGFCINHHDDWLEAQDIGERNDFFHATVIKAGLSTSEFLELYFNTNITNIKLNQNGRQQKK